MNYITLFNALADGSPALPKLIETAVRAVNDSKSLSVSDREMKSLLKEYTVTAQETNDTAVLELDVEKMDGTAKYRGQFQHRLGTLFEGLAERQNVVDGRRITLNIMKSAASPAPKA